MKPGALPLPPAEQAIQKPAVEPAVGLRPHIAGGRDRDGRQPVGRRQPIR
jgi:hypothetical protein